MRVSSREKTHKYLKYIVMFSVIAAAAVLLGNNRVFAAGNPELSFEGKITNSSGVNIADGTYSMEFKIYTGCTNNLGAGCTAVWTEDYTGAGQLVTFTSGTFQVNLGSITAFASLVPWDTNPLYLSLQIGGTSTCTPAGNFTTNCGGDGVMSPYILLTSTPYAQDAAMLGGLTSSQYIQTTPTVSQTILPTTNVSSLIIQQNNSGSFGTDVFDVQGSSGGTNNFLQVTSTAANAGAVTLQSLGANALSLQSGGAINFDTNNVANTLQIGNTANAVAQTINIGNNTTASSADTIALGSLVGSSITTIQGGTGSSAITLKAGSGGILTIGNQASSTANTINIGNTTAAITNADNVNVNTSTAANTSVIQFGGTGMGISETLTGSATAPTDVVKSLTNNSGALQVQNADGENLVQVDTTASTNYISDAEFALGSGTCPSLTDWSAVGSPTTCTQNTTAVNTYEGQTSLQLLTHAAAGDGITTSSFTSAPPTAASGAGQYYTVSFYVEQTTGTALTANNLQVKATYNSGSTVTCTGSASITLSTSYFQQVSCTLTFAAASTISALQINSQSAAAKTFFIDGVQLQQAATSAGTLTPLQLGNIQIRGIITNPLALQNTSNSTTAFQIANAAGTNLLNADTTIQALTINTPSTNTATATVNIHADSTGAVTNSYITAGTKSFVVPADVTSVTVDAWGAGGGGGAGSGGASGKGGGGGGGGQAIATITVYPGETLTVGVGTGGAKAVNNEGSGISGGNGGGQSYIKRSSTYLIQAPGGGGGGAMVGLTNSGGQGGGGGSQNTTAATSGTGNATNGGVGATSGGGGAAGGPGAGGGVGGSAGTANAGGGGAPNAAANCATSGNPGTTGTGGGGKAGIDTGACGDGGGGGGGAFGGGGGGSNTTTTDGAGGGGGGYGATTGTGTSLNAGGTAVAGTGGTTPSDSNYTAYCGTAGVGGTGGLTAAAATAGGAGCVVITYTTAANNPEVLNVQTAAGVDMFRVTSDGSAVFRDTTDNTQNFQVQNSSGSNIFSTDTTDGYVIIATGSTGEANAALLILDNQNTAADPSPGISGAMYYNASIGQFRCFEQGIWFNCVGPGDELQRQMPFISADFIGANVGQVAPFHEFDVGGGSVALDTNDTNVNHPGNVQFVSTATNPSGTDLDTCWTCFNLGAGYTYSTIIKQDSLTNVTERFGFVDNSANNAVSNGVWVEVPSTGIAVGKTSQSGTASTSGAICTLTAGNWYRIVVVMTSLTQADFYIYNDGAGNTLCTNAGTGHTSLGTNLPTGAAQRTGFGDSAISAGTAQTIFGDNYQAFWLAQPIAR
jgi:hypothetical protein